MIAIQISVYALVHFVTITLVEHVDRSERIIVQASPTGNCWHHLLDLGSSGPPPHGELLWLFRSLVGGAGGDNGIAVLIHYPWK